MDTTIAAISTAYGESGIGIVRMSGPEAFSIAKKIFVPGGKGSDKASAKSFEPRPRYMHYGHIKDPDTGSVLDEVLCVFMQSPHTYTAEDLVEIQCHGSMLALKNILELCLKQGAVPAAPGEFSERAFLNGRLDLSQAEAVIDLIKARSGKSFDVALGQLQGQLSQKVEGLRKELLDLLVELTVNMDYPDEDIEYLQYQTLENSLLAIDDELRQLLNSAAEGKILREGIGIALVGKPNVGKSSFLNALLKENRSIVTEIPGTTRDTIEEQTVIRGIPVRLTDTAGIHDSEDPVETLGIERSKDAFNKADLVVLILDAGRPFDLEDMALTDMLQGRQCIIILNKCDLPQLITEDEMRAEIPGALIIRASMKTGEGITEFCDAVEQLILGGRVRRENDAVLTNARQTDCVRRALNEISEAIAMTRLNEAMDFIEVNVHAAYDALGEIVGETASDDVIKEVFSRFCLGK